ncbi:MAG: RNA 3'-terminal phosphate cyclase [Myxococcota bacterium]
MEAFEPLEIDGRDGEGGGQIVRTSVALSAVTGRPLRLIRVRAGRAKPGLQAQHLAAVKAVATVCEADTDGLRLGAERFRFVPGKLRGGRFDFRVATAGSAGLVLHAVLPALLRAPEPSEVVFEGGTHVRSAPPFEHVRYAFLPALAEMGIRAELTLERPGFFPKGGGRMVLRVEPWTELHPLSRSETVAIKTAQLRGTCHVGKLPSHVTERAERRLKNCGVASLPDEGLAPSPGPGLAVCVEVKANKAVDVVTALGEKGRPTEHVVDEAVESARAHLKAEAPVGPFLADQLLLYLALGAGGSFLTVPTTRHFETQVRTLGRFLSAQVRMTPAEGRVQVEVDAADM